jgi:hypothetical protein
VTADKKPYKQELPPDAMLVKQIGSFVFYFSKMEHTFYIETADYHAGPVALARAEILGLLNIFDKQSAEKEKELISDLEQDDDDF